MNTQQKVYDMLDGFDTAMLVTTTADGRLESRPMRLAEVEPAGPIWLLTSTATRKAAEVAAHPAVLLVCQDEHGQYLSVRGRARLVRDEARVRRIFKEPFRVWFPDGPDDPNVALMAIDPIEAEFWDTSGVNRLKHLWESAKFLAGEPPDPTLDEDQHGKTTL